MPDTEGRQVLPGEVFNRNVAALTPPPPNSNGGITRPENYKSFVVEIRPKKWKTEKFWIGQIANYVDAQFIAEAVFYYTGHPSFHLKSANFEFPPLECIIKGAPTWLTNREMFSQYASSIAKGSEFKTERKDFRQRVKELVLEEVKSVRVQRVLLQFRDAANPVEEDGDEGDEGNDGDDGNEGVQADHTAPMEVDDHSEQATRLSKVVPEAVDRHVEGGNLHVPSFGISGPGFTLQSDFTPVDEFSWDVEAYLCSFKNIDCHEILTNGKEDFSGSTMGDPEESSCDAFENFRANFFAVEDAGIDLEDVSWKMLC